MSRLFLLLALFFMMSPFLSAAAPDSIRAVSLQPEQRQRSLSFLFANLIRAFHYSKTPIDDSLSRKCFKVYLDTLDPMHLFFLQTEVDSFRNAYETELDDMLLANGGSDLSFAFEAYNIVNVRMHDYYRYICREADAVHDFTTADSFAFERKDAPYPADRNEMEELWRKRLVNELLIERISRRAEADKRPDTAPVLTVQTSDSLRIADGAKIKKRLRQICTFFEGRTPLDVTEMYLCALSRVFDPHSGYMAPKTEEQFNIVMGLQLVGIGAELTIDDGYVKINRIIPGGPADKCKVLKVNDRIIAAAEENGEPVSLVDMPIDKAVNYIRGKEKTAVTLTYLDGSAGLGAAPQKLRLVREKIELKDAEAKADSRIIADGDKKLRVGIITLPSFYFNFNPNGTPKSAYEDVRKLILDLEKQPLDGLILDLRSNGGGALIDAIRISGLFISQGVIVQIRDANGNIMPGVDDNPELLYKGPLIVMVNKFSASASEIFAAAMQDYQRTVIVGDAQTHGKGTVQEVRDLNRYAAAFNLTAPLGSIKFTQAKFYRVNGETTQLKGVVPDVIFPSFTDQIESGESSLEYALPFDTIPAAKSHAYIPNYQFVLKTLREASAKRIAESEKFKILREQILYLAEQKKNKTISLNEEERWKRYQTEKEIADRQAELLKIDPETGTDSVVASGPKDIYMNETLNIMRDFCNTLPRNR